MIPIRDEVRARIFPIATITLVLINVAVFVYQAYFGAHTFDSYLWSRGLIPAELTGHSIRHLSNRWPYPVLTILSAMFMHGSWFHLLFNMLFLWIFGDNIEETLGRIRFILFYLLTGSIATLTHVFSNPNSQIPLVGASGAIAGLLGAYLILFPTHRIVTLVPIFFYFTTVRVPAAFFLLIWFLLQILSTGAGEVAWWAHIGGFVSGMVLIGLFVVSRGTRRQV